MYCGVPSDRQPGLCHARATSVLHGQRNTKICHHRAAALQQHVFRFDVAVHNAARMRVLERISDFRGQSNRVGYRQLPLAIKTAAQRLPFHERHHIVQQAVGHTRVEERKNVRMLQTGREFDFAEETLGPEHRREFGVQHLDGDTTLVPHIRGQKDGRHAAFADFAIHRVAVGDGGGETIQKSAHMYWLRSGEASGYPLRRT